MWRSLPTAVYVCSVMYATTLHVISGKGLEHRKEDIMAEKMKNLADLSIVIKGAGEMASGIAHRLYRAGNSKLFVFNLLLNYSFFIISHFF